MHPSKHRIETELEIKFRIPGFEDMEVAYPKVEIDYHYLAGDPGLRTFRNGDPGYPPAGAEIEVIAVKWIDGDGLEQPDAKTLHEWAQNYADEKGYEIFCEWAEEDLCDRYWQAKADAKGVDY
jgi:hypothetical protein